MKIQILVLTSWQSFLLLPRIIIFCPLCPRQQICDRNNLLRQQDMEALGSGVICMYHVEYKTTMKVWIIDWSIYWAPCDVVHNGLVYVTGFLKCANGRSDYRHNKHITSVLRIPHPAKNQKERKDNHDSTILQTDLFQNCCHHWLFMLHLTM